MEQLKYVAILVEGFHHWLWFDTDNVTIENYQFRGRKGWGKDGAYTEIDIPESRIIGKIRSDTLQYKS